MKSGTVTLCRRGCVVVASLAIAFTTMSGLAQETKSVSALTPQSRADLPEATTIIARYIEAVGGREALRKTTSRHITGSFMVPEKGIEASLEIFRSKPDKLLIHVELPSRGKMTQGYDGKVAFLDMPTVGVTLLEGNQLEQMRETADFYTELHRPDKFTSMQTVDLTEFEGKLCYRVNFVSKAGRKYAEFFDKETGLLAGNLGLQDMDGREVEQITVYSDYKTFGELLLPTRTEIRVISIVQVMTFESIEFNDVSDTVYDLPDAVKSLVNAAPSMQPGNS